jgi:hypothetical protein
MTEKRLRAVETISLSEEWDHEEADFTPWLVDNIELLADAIGIEIEDVEREEDVGGYRADITGTEMNTDGTVVIENQYGGTDHNHLGQLLTYAAGTDATFVIWLAEEFRDEHRSVLEWLNSSGPDAANFFGVRPRVVRLEGTEERGFEFNVTVEPNDWERELTESLTTREQAYKDFFTELTQRYAERNPNWNQLTPQPQSWLAFGAGISGIRFSWSFHQGPEISTELYIDTSEKERNAEIFTELKEDEESIVEELGNVVWQRLPEKRACRIKVARSISGPIEELNASERREIEDWAIEQMDDLREVFEPRLERL